jgi:2-iminobutanoate/2-iminopropanoate deaminase
MKMKTLTLLTLSLVLSCSCASAPHYFRDSESKLPFSSSVRVGNLVFVSGHLGRDKTTGNAPADVAEEVRLMLDAFAASLAKAGMTMDNLVAVQVHCTDLSHYTTFNDIYRKRFKKNFPTRAFIGAGSLLRGCRFEILGTAAD